MYKIEYYSKGALNSKATETLVTEAENYDDAVKLACSYISDAGIMAGAIIRKVSHTVYRQHAQTSNRIVRVEYSTKTEANTALALIPRECNRLRAFMRREIIKSWHLGVTEPTE